MSTLKILYNQTDFCPLAFSYNRRFYDLVKSGIKPLSYRRYNKEKKRWSVHIAKIPMVVSWGRRHFAYVDYSSLPTPIQILIVEYERNRREAGGGRELSLTPHQVLHLLPSAPPEVIKASYKALAMLYHPDHGGDSEQFRAVQEAFDSLTRNKDE